MQIEKKNGSIILNLIIYSICMLLLHEDGEIVYNNLFL
jgi:hypothetical protein